MFLTKPVAVAYCTNCLSFAIDMLSGYIHRENPEVVLVLFIDIEIFIDPC